MDTNTMIREQLEKKTVGIAGCGGLGSNAAVALARVGIGKLILADFDVVTESNLNRQYFFYDQIGQKKVKALRDNLLRVNPGMAIEIHDITLTAGGIQQIFSSCDGIIEAFDQAAAKEMLAETVLTHFPDVFLVMGVGLAGWGNNDSIFTRYEGNIAICGDGKNEVSEQIPPLAPRVGIVSNMQANIMLEYLLGPCQGLQ